MGLTEHYLLPLISVYIKETAQNKKPRKPEDFGDLNKVMSL